MNYCSNCGASLQFLIPPGDHLPRYVCNSCKTIHYQNPKLVVGCIPEWEDKILLCRRAIEPGHGLWTLPAGFMENSETTQQGAAREAMEEAHAEVRINALYSLYNLPHINQVHVFFRAALLDLSFRPGIESLEVALFREDGIPWERLAFASVRETLQHYYRDRRAGDYGCHTGDIVQMPRQAVG